MKTLKALFLALIAILIIVPASAMAVTGPMTILSIDMDPFTDGIQSRLETAHIGDIITTDIVMDIMAGASISAFSFSIDFDNTELALIAPPVLTPLPGFFALTPGFNASDANNLYNYGNVSLFAPAGPGRYNLGSVQWEVLNPVRDGLNDITPYAALSNFAHDPLILGDDSADGFGAPVQLAFQGGAVAPEPVSTTLFLIGGAGLVARRYFKK
ncbi:hypothetical protein H8E50_03420 [bacterium]|nr:hypothetical protein [bacterium]